MQRRRRSWRRSWPLRDTEPVAGNFYPVTSAATLRGAPPLASGEAAAAEAEAAEPAEFELSLVTDRPQAVASLESGSMHVLLHRRLLQVRWRDRAERRRPALWWHVRLRVTLAVGGCMRVLLHREGC